MITDRAMAAALTEDELIRIGTDLAELANTAGWGRFMELLGRFEQDVALRGLRDRNRPRSYYEGYADALGEVRGAVTYLVEEARAAADVKAKADSTYAPPRLAPSSVSGA